MIIFRGIPHPVYTLILHMPVRAHTYRMLIVLLLPARKVFYYFITERVCVSILRSRMREKWGIAAPTVPWTSDRPVAKYCA